MNKTIQALSEAIKEDPLNEKLLFVPSYSIGHQLGENLARSVLDGLKSKYRNKRAVTKNRGQNFKETKNRDSKIICPDHYLN